MKTCAPIGDMSRRTRDPQRCDCGTPYTCAGCGAPVSRQPAPWDDPARQEWKWVDTDGCSFGDATPEALTTKVGWDDLAATDVGTYSILSARDLLGVTGWIHQHRAAPCGYGREAHPPVDRLPDCCDYPMMARPQGWSCRATGAFFPYVSVVEAAA